MDFDETDPAKRMTDMAMNSETTSGSGVEKNTLTAYENALAAAEDETDVAAARVAKEEAVAELAEFDENIPLENDGNETLASQNEELSKAEQEVNALIEQVTKIVLLSTVKKKIGRMVGNSISSFVSLFPVDTCRKVGITVHGDGGYGVGGRTDGGCRSGN